jgi:hypothetical protein
MFIFWYLLALFAVITTFYLEFLVSQATLGKYIRAGKSWRYIAASFLLPLIAVLAFLLGNASMHGQKVYIPFFCITVGLVAGLVQSINMSGRLRRAKLSNTTNHENDVGKV